MGRVNFMIFLTYVLIGIIFINLLDIAMEHYNMGTIVGGGRVLVVLIWPLLVLLICIALIRGIFHTIMNYFK